MEQLKEKKDLFEEVRKKVGCESISDLPYQKRRAWKALKEVDTESYPEQQVEDFSRYVFRVKYGILQEVMNKGGKVIQQERRHIKQEAGG